MNKTVYVVTNPELGWDCVVGVFSGENLTKKEIKQRFPDQEYCIFEQNLEEDLSNHE